MSTLQSGRSRASFWHRHLLAWITNPATLITVLAPVTISVCVAYFISSNDHGTYRNLIKEPNTCALLEHRTNLYTLIVASAFLIFELVK